MREEFKSGSSHSWKKAPRKSFIFKQTNSFGDLPFPPKQQACMPLYSGFLILVKNQKAKKQMFISIVIKYHVFQADLLCHYLFYKFVCFTFQIISLNKKSMTKCKMFDTSQGIKSTIA